MEMLPVRIISCYALVNFSHCGVLSVLRVGWVFFLLIVYEDGKLCDLFKKLIHWKEY